MTDKKECKEEETNNIEISMEDIPKIKKCISIQTMDVVVELESEDIDDSLEDLKDMALHIIHQVKR